MKQFALTTIDNPFDPFEDFVSWMRFDSMYGNNCLGLVERYADTSDFFSDEENEKLREKAIDEIIANDHLKIYKKVIKEV